MIKNYHKRYSKKINIPGGSDGKEWYYTLTYTTGAAIPITCMRRPQPLSQRLINFISDWLVQILN